MELTVSIKTDLHFDEANEQILKAAREALKDCVVDTAQDAMEGSPKKSGNNMRSITWALGWGEGQRDLELLDLQGAVYSTSGYGGYLETGTGIYGPNATPITPVNAKVLAWQDKAGDWHYAKSVKGMPAQPYLKPAADRNFTEQKFGERFKTHLGES